MRPYPPAFPNLRGGELAFIATEHLSRFDPPATLSGAISYLAQRGASAVAIRGDVSEDALDVAREYDFPVVRLLTEMALQDIEQAVMRECALHEARREMSPQDRHTWAESLLGGEVGSLHEAQSLARKQGYTLASHYTVAYLTYSGPDTGKLEGIIQSLEEQFNKGRKAGVPMPVALAYEQGIAVLFPQGVEAALPWDLLSSQIACGIGNEQPTLKARVSLEEAQLASLASALLRGALPTCYGDLGADRLLLLLHRDHPGELRAFVEETLGPLLRHDARSATPLLPTVEAFIRHGGRLRETAAEIYVHRNTLAYRLDRAAEILSVDWKDAQARLAVEIALRGLSLVKAL